MWGKSNRYSRRTQQPMTGICDPRALACRAEKIWYHFENQALDPLNSYMLVRINHPSVDILQSLEAHVDLNLRAMVCDLRALRDRGSVKSSSIWCFSRQLGISEDELFTNSFQLHTLTGYSTRKQYKFSQLNNSDLSTWAPVSQ